MAISGTDVRIVCAPLEITRAALTSLLRTEKMEIVDDGVQTAFTALSRHRSLPHHFQRPKPQQIKVELQPARERRTEVACHFSLFPRFRWALWAGVLVPCALGNAAMWTAIVAASHGKRSIALVSLSALPLLGAVWWRFICRCTSPVRFCNILYDRLAQEWGLTNQTIDRTASPDLLKLAMLSLFGWLMILTPFVGEIVKAPLAAGSVALLVCGCFCLIANAQGIEKALARWPQGFVTFVVTAVLVILGLLPWWGGEALELPVRLLTTAKENISPNLAVLPVVGLILATSLIAVLLPALGFWRSLPQLVRNLDAVRAHPEAVLRISIRENRFLRIFTVISWLSLGALSLISCVLALSLVSYSVLGSRGFLVSATERFLASIGTILNAYQIGQAQIELTLRWAAFLCGLPFVGWLLLNAFRNIAQLWHYLRLRFVRSSSSEVDRGLKDVVNALASFAGVEPVPVRIVRWNHISGFLCVAPIPGLRPLIVLSRRAIEMLPRRQLEAILAHEMGHLKHKHAERMTLLSFLSRCGLLAEGFLNAWQPFSWEQETQADAFAVSWLENGQESKGGSDSLIEALKSLEQWNIASAITWRTGQEIGFSLANSGDWLPQKLRRILDGPAPSLGWLTRFQLFWWIHFETAGLTYAYLPFSKRIEQINETRLQNELARTLETTIEKSRNQPDKICFNDVVP